SGTWRPWPPTRFQLKVACAPSSVRLPSPNAHSPYRPARVMAPPTYQWPRSVAAAVAAAGPAEGVSVSLISAVPSLRQQTGGPLALAAQPEDAAHQRRGGHEQHDQGLDD